MLRGPWFPPLAFGIAQRNLQNQSTRTRRTAPTPHKKRRLYQMWVLIQSFRVPVLIQVQQNSLNGLFLNTAWTTYVKTRMNLSSVQGEVSFPLHYLNRHEHQIQYISVKVFLLFLHIGFIWHSTESQWASSTAATFAKWSGLVHKHGHFIIII